MSVPIDITDDTLASSLVPVQCASLAPPVEMDQKFHIFSDCTHTHTLVIETGTISVIHEELNP